jgi:hypothetical protein
MGLPQLEKKGSDFWEKLFFAPLLTAPGAFALGRAKNRSKIRGIIKIGQAPVASQPVATSWGRV